MKKKMFILGMVLAMSSSLTYANSTDYTTTYPGGGSNRTVVDGSGLKMSYTWEGKNFTSTDTIVSSSLFQIFEGKEEAYGPYKKTLVLRPGVINSYDEYGTTYMVQGRVGTSKITRDADGNIIHHYSELTQTGLDNGNNKIINVKAGEADTDGVNVSQLKGVVSMVYNQDTKINKLGDIVNSTVGQVNTNTRDIADLKGKVGNTDHIIKEANTYTDSTFKESTNYTDSKIREANAYTDQRIAKAGAANAALSALKYLDYDANHKLSAAASFGQYKGATAGAVGLAYQPNEDVLVHLGATVGSEHMLNGGVSIRVGDTSKGIKANTKNLAKELNDIKAENAELKAELAEIKAMLANR